MNSNETEEDYFRVKIHVARLCMEKIREIRDEIICERYIKPHTVVLGYILAGYLLDYTKYVSGKEISTQGSRVVEFELMNIVIDNRHPNRLEVIA